jgi:hypothetical protein
MAVAGRNVHTVYSNGASVWQSKFAGGSAFDSHSTKAAAVAAGRVVAMREKSEHIIHDMDGTIGSRNSYGNDPFPPVG